MTTTNALDAPDAPPTAVWFREDLRTIDHEPLLNAAERGPVHCVYVFDPRCWARTRVAGFQRVGPFRARFLLESVRDLRARLRGLGGDLIVRRGLPEEVLPRLVSSWS